MGLFIFCVCAIIFVVSLGVREKEDDFKRDMRIREARYLRSQNFWGKIKYKYHSSDFEKKMDILREVKL